MAHQADRVGIVETVNHLDHPDDPEPLERSTALVEFEAMLLVRHGFLTNPSARREYELLDRSAYVVLSRLALQGPMTLGELHDAFGLDTSTLNRQTAAMRRAGIVERIPDPDGGLARKIRITPEGRRRLDADRARLVDALGQIMGDWTPDEVAGFASAMRRFNRGIEKLDGRPWPRPDEA